MLRKRRQKFKNKMRIAFKFVSFETRLIKLQTMAKKEESTDSNKKSESPEKGKAYDKLIKKLKNERKNLQDEISREYKEGRRYVRSHPEEGVLIGFIGGIAIGVLLGRLMK